MRSSEMKRTMQNGQWHYFAIVLNDTAADFYHDGVFKGSSSLPRQITDCNGKSYIAYGSTSTLAEISSLRIMPFRVDETELSGSLMVEGSPFDELVAGNTVDDLPLDRTNVDVPNSLANIANQISALPSTVLTKIDMYLSGLQVSITSRTRNGVPFSVTPIFTGIVVSNSSSPRVFLPSCQSVSSRSACRRQVQDAFVAAFPNASVSCAGSWDFDAADSVDDLFSTTECSTVPSANVVGLFANYTKVESELCLLPAFLTACPENCGACEAARAPSRDKIHHSVDSCKDETSFRDYAGDVCEWYRLHDDEKCSKYGDTATLDMCRLSCGSCDYAYALLNATEIRADEHVDFNEASNIFQVLEGFRLARSAFLALAVDVCREAGTDTAWCRREIGTHGVPLSYFELTPSKSYTALSSAVINMATSELISTQSFSSELDIIYLASINGEATVADYPVSITRQFTLVAPWVSCANDFECQTVTSSECGPNFVGKCPFSANHKQSTFCSDVCFTGGCDSTASVLPMARSNTAGYGWCQPCTDCELATRCPHYCSQFSKTSSDTTSDTVPVAVGEKVYADGGFTILVWIKEFNNQYIARKVLRVPRSPGWNDVFDEGANGYDQQSITCWSLSTKELMFRSGWSERNMSVRYNPMLNKLQDDQWHLLSVVKESTEQTMSDGSVVRSDTLKFMVDMDTEDSGVSTEGLAEYQKPGVIAPYSFFDCGGLFFFDANMDIAAGSTMQEAGQWTVTMQEMAPDTYPYQYIESVLGQSAVQSFNFVNVKIPQGAFIAKAHLAFCAEKHSIESIFLGEQLPVG